MPFKGLRGLREQALWALSGSGRCKAQSIKKRILVDRYLESVVFLIWYGWPLIWDEIVSVEPGYWQLERLRDNKWKCSEFFTLFCKQIVSKQVGCVIRTHFIIFAILATFISYLSGDLNSIDCWIAKDGEFSRVPVVSCQTNWSHLQDMSVIGR